MRVDGQRHASVALQPGIETRYQFYTARLAVCGRFHYRRGPIPGLVTNCNP
jgi:hypothetical protein